MGLGDLPGGPIYSKAWGVSADGSIVLGFSEGASGLEAFIWDATNGMQGLGDLPGGSYSSVAYGISADGAIVVGAGESASGDEAFHWDATNGIQSLGELPGGNYFGLAQDISADGSTIVGFSDRASGTEAFVWDATNGMQGLGGLSGPSTFSFASDVSADGSIIAGGSSSLSGFEAFIWDATRGMQGLGDLPGGSYYSEALGISDDASTVVGHGAVSSGREAFRWDATNGLQSLGDLPGGAVFGRALAVSSDGSRIVGSGTGTSGLEAFIWDATNGMRRVADELNGLGVVLPTGWTLEEATHVSPDGSTIVGYGNNPSGQTEAWLATVSGVTTVGMTMTSVAVTSGPAYLAGNFSDFFIDPIVIGVGISSVTLDSQSAGISEVLVEVSPGEFSCNGAIPSEPCENFASLADISALGDLTFTFSGALGESDTITVPLADYDPGTGQSAFATIVSPAHLATGVSTNASMQWTSSPAWVQAALLRLHDIGAGVLADSTLLVGNPVPDTSWNPGGLTDGNSYQFSVSYFSPIWVDDPRLSTNGRAYDYTGAFESYNASYFSVPEPSFALMLQLSVLAACVGARRRVPGSLDQHLHKGSSQ